MLNRKIDSEIEKHFASTKKAMFLTGARQVGKTYAIRKYARQHDLRLVEMLSKNKETFSICTRSIYHVTIGTSEKNSISTKSLT